MSEVQRYYVGKYGLVEGEALGRLSVVLAADFDRVTAERDAVRETLENSYTAEDHERLVAKGQELNVKYIEKLEQRLTAADERADVLEGLLKSGSSPTYAHCAAVMEALKPAEGGGDHVKHYECIGKGGDYTVVAIAQGAGTLKGFNHYVYKNADGVHFVRDPEDFLSRMQIRP